VANPGEQSANSSFYQDTMRETKQTAFFTSLDFDLIPKVLTATVGTRYFHFENSSVGSVTGSFDCFEQGTPVGGCVADGYNLNSQNLRDTETGFKSRANLTWHITPDTMVYYTFSQGFRPGGFNQNGGTAHAFGTDGVAQYLLPKSYQSDKLTNNEIGWKTEFFDHRLQWNGAVYRENWDNVQVAFFDPGLVGNIFYNANGQNFLIKGVETSLVGRVLPGLTLQGAASWNQSRQTNSPVLIDNNPASNNYGKPITTNCNGLALRAGHESLRSGRLSQRQFAAAAVQPARTLRMGHRGLQPLRAGRRHPQRPFVHAGGLESDPQRKPVGTSRYAVRESRLFDLRGFIRRREGRLDIQRVRGEPEQFECQHLRQYRSIHRRTDAAAAAGHRSLVLV
jgi:hypothetical protein